MFKDAGKAVYGRK